MTARPIEHHIQINGLPFHYVEWGIATNPTVLIHHGFLDQCRSWDRVAERLANRWHLIVPDARGHGDTGWIGAGATYYFPDYLLDLHALHKHLGSKPLAFVGHSMGGSVVSYYVGTYPNSAWSMVLVEGMGPPDMSKMDTAGLFMRYIESASKRIQRRNLKPMQSVDEAAGRMLQWDAKLTPERALEVASQAVTDDGNGMIRWKHDPLHRTPMAVPFILERILPLWQNISCPVLHVMGSDSPFKNADTAQREASFQQLTNHTIEGAGHNVHTHKDEELAMLIDQFLAQSVP